MAFTWSGNAGHESAIRKGIGIWYSCRVCWWRTTTNNSDDDNASSLQQGGDNETFGDSPIYAPTLFSATWTDCMYTFTCLPLSFLTLLCSQGTTKRIAAAGPAPANINTPAIKGFFSLNFLTTMISTSYLGMPTVPVHMVDMGAVYTGPYPYRWRFRITFLRPYLYGYYTGRPKLGVDLFFWPCGECN